MFRFAIELTEAISTFVEVDESLLLTWALVWGLTTNASEDMFWQALTSKIAE